MRRRQRSAARPTTTSPRPAILLERGEWRSRSNRAARVHSSSCSSAARLLGPQQRQGRRRRSSAERVEHPRGVLCPHSPLQLLRGWRQEPRREELLLRRRLGSEVEPLLAKNGGEGGRGAQEGPRRLREQAGRRGQRRGVREVAALERRGGRSGGGGVELEKRLRLRLRLLWRWRRSGQLRGGRCRRGRLLRTAVPSALLRRLRLLPFRRKIGELVCLGQLLRGEQEKSAPRACGTAVHTRIAPLTWRDTPPRAPGAEQCAPAAASGRQRS